MAYQFIYKQSLESKQYTCNSSNSNSNYNYNNRGTTDSGVGEGEQERDRERQIQRQRAGEHKKSTISNERINEIGYMERK